MAKNYKDLLLELHSNKTKECSFTFGRFQPVTIAHQLVFDSIKNSDNDGFVFVSPNEKNPKDNPIPVESRAKAIKELELTLTVIIDCSTIMDVIKFLDDNGYTNATMYVGSDRVDSFKDVFNGAAIDVKIVQVGQDRIDQTNSTKSDSEGLRAISGSYVRSLAASGDFDAFKETIPSELTMYSLDWYNKIRASQGKDSQTNEDIMRESYHAGKLFKVGSYVMTESNETGRVISNGNNYVGVVHRGGDVKKYWTNQLHETIGSKFDKELFKTKVTASGQISYMGYTTQNLTGSVRSELIGSGMFESTDYLKTLKTLKNIDFGIIRL